MWHACILITATLIAMPASAQLTDDRPLPPAAGQPRGAPIRGDDGLAWLSGDRVWAASLVPGSSVQSPLALPAPLIPADGWLDLGHGRALYQAQGTDLLPWTSDDRWVVLRGLPFQPAWEDLGPRGALFAGAGPTPWTVSPAGVAVYPDEGAQTFTVLDPRATPTTVTVLASPQPFRHGSFGQRFAWLQGGATLVGFGPGPDGAPGTGDEEFIRLEGVLAQPVALAATAEASGFAMRGTCTTREGALVTWDLSGYDAIQLAVRRPRAATFDIIGVGFPSYGSPPGIPPMAVRVESLAGTDTLWLSVVDDVPIEHHLLLDLGGGAAQERARWTDDWNAGSGSVALDPQTVARWSGMGPTFFEVLDFRDAVPPGLVPVLSTHNFAWWSDLQIELLGTNSLIAYGAPWNGTFGTFIVEDLRGSNVRAQSFEAGNYFGAPTGQPLGTAINAGLAACFLDLDEFFPYTAEVLRVQSVPGAHRLAPAPTGPMALELDIQPLIDPQWPLVFQASSGTAPLVECLLVIGSLLDDPLTAAQVPGLAGGHELHIDPARPFVLFPFPLPDPSSQMVLEHGWLPTAPLVGLEWNLQLVGVVAQGGLVASNPWTLVLR
jgi:hypothetical protein